MKTCRTPFPSLGGIFPLLCATVVVCNLIIFININFRKYFYSSEVVFVHNKNEMDLTAIFLSVVAVIIVSQDVGRQKDGGWVVCNILNPRA